MTPEAQNIAIAKLDGWRPNPYVGLYQPTLRPECNINQKFKLPRFLTSYDAIIPLLQKQSMEVREAVCKWLGLKHDYCAWISATPTQLAEALLRATGLWEDPNDTTTVLKGKKYQ